MWGSLRSLNRIYRVSTGLVNEITTQHLGPFEAIHLPVCLPLIGGQAACPKISTTSQAHSTACWLNIQNKHEGDKASSFHSADDF